MEKEKRDGKRETFLLMRKRTNPHRKDDGEKKKDEKEMKKDDVVPGT